MNLPRPRFIVINLPVVLIRGPCRARHNYTARPTGLIAVPALKWSRSGRDNNN